MFDRGSLIIFVVTLIIKPWRTPEDTNKYNTTYYDVLLCITTCYDVLRRITTYYYVLQRITTHYDVLRRITTYYDVIRCTTTYCLRRITTYYDVLRRIVRYYGVLRRTLCFWLGNVTFGVSTSCLFVDRQTIAFIDCNEHKIDTSEKTQEIDTNRHE